MDWGAAFIEAGSFAVREISLFAAAGFLLLGAGDLVVDFTWIGLRIKHWLAGTIQPGLADLPAPPPRRLAVFVPAWDEDDVIGAMLGHALRTFEHSDYRIYVGCYPNDPRTIAAVCAVADPRVRLVIGQADGPTTKADCLNRLWEALLEDDAAEGVRARAVILHDAEDVVHGAELRLFDALIDRFDFIQIPVVPLIDRRRRGVSATYADDFAENHGKEMVVRQALGAGIPSAGVGCAFSREALEALAAAQGHPFDPLSLTEDYEAGLRLHAAGFRSTFVRMRREPGGSLICSRGYFPRRPLDAVNQRARWIAGIALAGWDRLGWSGGLAERWMRLRDRQALLAALLLLAAYFVLLAAPLVATAAWATDRPIRLMTPALKVMMDAAMLLLLWRLIMRFGFVSAVYGWHEGLRAVPRIVIGNAIAMLAARQAVGRYLRQRRTGEAQWGKTSHMFPVEAPAE